MFLPNSRYAHVVTVETTTSTGESAVALTLRRLTPVVGTPHIVEQAERLDLHAHSINGDATQFWHVADANTALDGRTLVATPGDTLNLPKG
jgi:hypothetical protein